MNILTLQSDNQSANGNVVYNRFMDWLHETNTDLMYMSPAEINRAIHLANGGPIRIPQDLVRRGGIVNPLAWTQAYNMVMQYLEDQEDILLPAGIPAAGESADQGEGQDDDGDILLPTGVGKPKKKNDNGNK